MDKDKRNSSTQLLELIDSTIDGIHDAYTSRGIICKFNRLWPNTAYLYKWIRKSWTHECDISLCSKGFSMVFFYHLEDYQVIFELCPWFWGRACLFITPWVPYFEPKKTSMTKMLIWIRLLDLPLHFWSSHTLEAIGSSIGKFLKNYLDRGKLGLSTYARICLEVDLSKGILEKIILKWKNTKWTIQLDYDNTTFHYRICNQTRHLQDTCPLRWNTTQGKKENKARNKRWNTLANP